MGGPSQHGQHNKTHKPGRHAGKSAREKHRAKKETDTGPRASVKLASHASKLERALVSKQQRDAKRNELIQARRKHSAPVIVGLLPLSDELNVQPMWQGLLAAHSGSSSGSGSKGLCTVVAQGKHRVRLMLLPPPADRHDPLAIVDLAKAAEVLLLLLPGHGGAVAVDSIGLMNLAVLRAMGLPTTVAVVLNQQQQQQQHLHAMGIHEDSKQQGGNNSSTAAKGSSVGLKERSAAKKRAEKVLQQHLPGDVKLLPGDTQQDMEQVLRALADSIPQLPVWRRQRPYIVVQQAAFVLDQQQQQQDTQELHEQQQQQTGQLHLTGYVRAQGLSANQLLTVPGAGDFRILRIDGPSDPAEGTAAQRQRQQQKGGSTDAVMSDAAGAAGNTATPVLAVPNPEQQEHCIRENVPDPLEGEQTWPTEEEIAAAAATAGRRMKKRKLPAGTSEYQAAWILDGDSDSENESNSKVDSDSMAEADDASAADAIPLSEDPATETDYGHEGDETDNMMMEDEEAEEEQARRLQAELKAKRLAEAEDAEFPDEIDTPQGVSARQRFAKYRGLKSFRSSPWDTREGLPPEYGHVFAFENFKRTAKRAREVVARATDGSDSCSVLPGSYVTVVLADVPAPTAAALVQRTAAAAASTAGTAAAAEDVMALDDVPTVGAVTGHSMPAGVVPITVYGLLQHEAKLSVVNFSIKKAGSYAETIKSKEDLLLVCGLRSFRAQPVFSDDGQGADKFKMERFLQAGRTAVGSVYAPISYPPLPLLAFKVIPGQTPQLAATGALRSVNPDRLVIKKIVLSGYPVRVHKTRAVVRLMFFNPDDVRWFKPVELWTKSGRRGRITEPLGTHGAFKARFDGPVQQRDSVCMSLYKRVFPKWPKLVGQLQEQQQQAGSEVCQLQALGMASFA